MKTIIITGSSGFIGSNIVNALSKKNKLILLLRVKKNSKRIEYIYRKNISFKYFKNYSELKIILKKITASWVIHCATHYVKNHKSEDINKIIDSNIELGTVLLDNLNIMGVKMYIS